LSAQRRLPARDLIRCAAALLMLCMAICAHARQDDDKRDIVQRPDDQMLIVGVSLGSTSLHDGMVAYSDGERVFLPLLELCRTLDIPIEGSAEAGTAEGWFREESWRFVLDTHRRMLSLNGREQTIDWALIERHEQDFYVPSESFADWLGLTLEVQLGNARIHLPSGQRLPLEQKLERKDRWARQQRQRPAALSDLPVTQMKAAWLAWPSIDATVSLGLNGDRDTSITTTRTDLLAAGEFLRSNAILSLSARDDSRQGSTIDTRLRLGRPATSANAIGWSAGDINAPLLPLLTAQADGLGIRIGNVDDMRSLADFSRTTLRGDALNGWDVELYRNNDLLAFFTVESTNQYRFDDVALQPGLNLFRVVMYGPQGQRRERLERIVVGDDMLTQGEQHWQGFAMLRDERLLPGPLNSGEQPRASTGSLMAGFGYRRALTSRWSMGLDALTAELDDGQQHRYLSARTQAGWLGLLLEGHWLRDVAGGWAGRLSAQSLGIVNNAGIDYERFVDFDSPEINGIEGGDDLTDRLRARWNNRRFERLSSTLEYELSRYRRTSGADAGTLRETRTSRLRLSQRWRALTTSTSLEARQETDRPTLVDGGMLLNYRRPRLDIASQWSYRFAPGASLRTANITANWNLHERFRLRANLNRSFDQNARTRFDLGLSWTTSRWLTSLQASRDSDGRYEIGLNMFTSLQRADRRWRADSRSGTGMSSVIAHVFLDRNGNGRFDDDDEPLPDVRFAAGLGGDMPKTDARGTATLTRLPANQAMTIAIREDSLGNPYWIPLSPAQQIRAQPGQVVSLSFAVMPSTEIDGIVYFMKGAQRKPASNVSLQLLDRTGALVRELRTAFDGAYLFDRVAPGDYTLQVAPGQLSRLSLRAPDARSFTLGDGKDVITIDWVLLPSSPN
jgi:hypothetical protein